MKPALVLGLALAANAMAADQYDNELIVAPTDQFGNIKKFPGRIMYDEQADDELLIRPIYTQTVYANVAADDELIVAPTDQFGNIKPYPRNIKFDEQADDELIVAPTDEFGRIKHYPPYIKFDEDGNEFFTAPTHRLGDIGHRILYDDELAAHASNVQALLERQFEFKGRLDDEADAELMTLPYKPYRVFDDLITRKVYDDEADTELMKAPYQRRKFDHDESRKVYDDEADTELMMAPLDGTGKYSRRRFDDHATRKVYDDEADSELMASPFRRKFDDLEGRKVYDDEADSELMTSAYRKKYDDIEGRRVYDDELLVREMRPMHHQAVDDELLVHPRRISQAVDDELLIHPRRISQAVDDELLIHPRRISQAVDDELLARPVRHSQAVDDELIIAPTKEFGGFKKFPGHIIMYDDNDNELLVKVDPSLFIAKQAEALRRRDDEELFSRRPIERQAEAHHHEVPKMGPKLFVQKQAEALRRDDEGDDELAYLSELLKNHKMDRFRDHELPEIKTKRPVNGAFLPII